MTTSNRETFVDFEQLIEALGDAVVVSDGEGAIRLWNSAAERLFGFSSAQAIGKTLDLIVPERFRERHWAGYKKTMTTGKTRYSHDVLRVPAVDKDGRPLSIAFTVGLLYDPDRQVTGIAAMIRDDTARFAEERKLRKQLAELAGDKARRWGLAPVTGGIVPSGTEINNQTFEERHIHGYNFSKRYKRSGITDGKAIAGFDGRISAGN
jgi:PAS domain S-box-containing protein